jgi:hypothetical protein
MPWEDSRVFIAGAGGTVDQAASAPVSTGRTPNGRISTSCHITGQSSATRHVVEPESVPGDDVGVGLPECATRVFTHFIRLLMYCNTDDYLGEPNFRLDSA